MHVNAGGVEAAGKGGLRYARWDTGWVSLSALIQSGEGGETAKRMTRLQPAATVIKFLTGYIGRPEGDGFSGFSAELRQGNLSSLARAPWVDDEEIKNCGSLRGRVQFDVSDGKFTTVTLNLSGSYVDMVRRHYYGQPDPNNPPTPPAPNWQLGPDGYWYEGQERSANCEIKIELSGFDEARIDDEVCKRIGLRRPKKR
jgi:hypothetical protein